MPLELLKRAIEQSEQREPLVRAMVLLHCARVLAAVDKDAARRAFAEGVKTAENLPLRAHHPKAIPVEEAGPHVQMHQTTLPDELARSSRPR